MPTDPPPQVTQRDVALATGVDQATVSRALKNSPKISSQQRRKIQAAAARMGYRPNAAASGLASLLRSSRTRNIQAEIAWLNFWPKGEELRGRHEEFNRYWNGALACAERHGYRLEEFRYRPADIKRLKEVLCARGIRGILIPPHPTVGQAGKGEFEQFATVRFGRSLPDIHTHIVAPDHVFNMMLAFETLNSRGYKRIGCIAGPSNSPHMLFDAGFLLAQQRFAPRKKLPILHLDFPASAANQKKFNAWLAVQNPDAIIAWGPQIPALIKARGLKIPSDLALAGMSIYDGNINTGINQNPEEIGRIGVITLLSLLLENEFGPPEICREILVKGTWQDGGSVP